MTGMLQEFVGQNPWSARVPPDQVIPNEQADAGVGCGPGGPPHGFIPVEMPTVGQALSPANRRLKAGGSQDWLPHLRFHSYRCPVAGKRKTPLCLLLLCATLPLFAAVDGTVINSTTGKPAAAAIVSLVQPGQGGMQTLASMKTDAQGNFRFEKQPQGPTLIQALYAGVLYNKVIMPGAPTSGMKVQVFDSTTKPEVAQVAQHFIVLQPGAAEMAVSEGILYHGDPKLTFNDPANGTFHFYLPPEAKGQVTVTINAPGGMPIQRPAEKTNQPNVYKVSYPIKPGETRFDLNYIVPVTSPLIFSGQILHREGASDLVIPSGVTIKGDDLELAGQEPKTQASIYRIKGASYKVEVEGTGKLQQAEEPAADEDSGMPSIEQVKPRIYDHLYLILGIAFATLGLGSFLLYRNSIAAKRG